MTRRLSILTSRALHGASRADGWGARTNLDYRPGVIHRHGGRAVTMAKPHVRYGIATDGRGGGVLHEVRAVFVAWFGGRPVGMLVATWCGSRLVTAELTDDPRRGVRPCVMCSARRTQLGQVAR